MLKKVWSYPVDFCIRFRTIPDNPTRLRASEGSERSEHTVVIGERSEPLSMVFNDQPRDIYEKRYIVAHIFKIELLAPRGRVSSQL